MGDASRTMRYHYSLRLRTLLSDWELYIRRCSRLEPPLSVSLSRALGDRVLPLHLLRTDSGGEFDWGGTSVKR